MFFSFIDTIKNVGIELKGNDYPDYNYLAAYIVNITPKAFLTDFFIDKTKKEFIINGIAEKKCDKLIEKIRELKK